jgi:hypothetical protein
MVDGGVSGERRRQPDTVGAQDPDGRQPDNQGPAGLGAFRATWKNEVIYYNIAAYPLIWHYACGHRPSHRQRGSHQGGGEHAKGQGLCRHRLPLLHRSEGDHPRGPPAGDHGQQRGRGNDQRSHQRPRLGCHRDHAAGRLSQRRQLGLFGRRAEGATAKPRRPRLLAGLPDHKPPTPRGQRAEPTVSATRRCARQAADEASCQTWPRWSCAAPHSADSRSRRRTLAQAAASASFA